MHVSFIIPLFDSTKQRKITVMNDRLHDPGFLARPTPNPFYTTEGTTVPIYHEGTLIKTVPVCWDWCKTQNEIEISDVRYGSIDGIILPHWDDIVEAIQTKMGVRTTLTFPDKFTLDLKL